LLVRTRSCHGRRAGRLLRGPVLLASAWLAAGCGEPPPTVVLVSIVPDPGLAMEVLVVGTVGWDADGLSCDPPPVGYPVTGTSWPQSVAILAGARCRAAVDVSVVGLAGGSEVARGGITAEFQEGATVKVAVAVAAICRDVVCEGRAFCGPDGTCTPGGRRRDSSVDENAAGEPMSRTVATAGVTGGVALVAPESEEQEGALLGWHELGADAGSAEASRGWGIRARFPGVCDAP
jgi:hypothetical protein